MGGVFKKESKSTFTSQIECKEEANYGTRRAHRTAQRNEKGVRVRKVIDKISRHQQSLKERARTGK